MFPHIQIFLKQTRRGTKRLVLQLVLLCAATAFFVVSLNLYANSMNNLHTVEDTYTTIATMEIYGYVNNAGELVHPGDESCVGCHWLSAEDYDLSPLLALDSVKSIDLRTRVGAYIPGNAQVSCTVQDDPFQNSNWVKLFGTDNVIRFTLDSEEPLVISLQDVKQELVFPIRILEATNSLLEYPDDFTLCVWEFDSDDISFFSEEIRRLNRSDCIDAITLYPDVEYVMATYGGWYWELNPETGTYTWHEDGFNCRYRGIGLQLRGFNFYKRLSYGTFGIQASTFVKNESFPLHRYEDVSNDPTWREYSLTAQYNASAFAVTLTDDHTLIPAWNQGAMYLSEGRTITKEEYKRGAKVCMVSAKMAANQGWQVGDTLDMHLYAYDAFYDGSRDDNVREELGQILPMNYLPAPNYSSDCGGFFEEDTYEIVGIFSQRKFTDFGDTAEEVFYNPWNAIYIPANAAPNAPEGPIQPSLITIELKNGSIPAFKAAVEELGLTEQKTGEYEIKFSYFDQGYSKIQPGLIEMNRNAKLLLALSGLLLLVTMVLMSFLFAQQHKHSAGILRMLGGSKKQAFTAILSCGAAVVASSGVVGTILGGVLTQSVGASILGETEASATVELAISANLTMTAFSGIGCVVLFLTLTAIFTATYIGKEPNALLPSAKN